MTTYDQEFFVSAGRRGGIKSASQRWRSLVDPELTSTKVGLLRLHKSRGYPLEEMERVQ